MMKEENTHLITPVVTSTFDGQIVPHLQEIQLHTKLAASWVLEKVIICVHKKYLTNKTLYYKIWHWNKEPLVSLCLAKT